LLMQREFFYILGIYDRNVDEKHKILFE
jgi:hypothetical protein